MVKVRLVTESYSEKEELIHRLADKYTYEPWRVRSFDMQRASVILKSPPVELLPEDLKNNFQFATLIMQGNGFTFTTSETSSIHDGWDVLSTPYSAEILSGPPNYDLLLTYDDIIVTDFSTLRLREIMGRPTLHYFPFKDKSTGVPLHTYLVINPYEGCAYRCRPCSRLPFFGSANPDYESNISKIVDDIDALVPEKDALKFINIITGSRDCADADIKLYDEVITAFNSKGFSSEYGVYTPNIHRVADMHLLRDKGIVFFTATMETTTPEARLAFYGRNNPKGKLSFEEILNTLITAESVFPYVNTNIMLGYEPIADVKRNLRTLAEKSTATVNHFIPRIFLKKQFDLIHPSARNLEYYIDMCVFVEREINAGRKSFGAFFEERFGIPKFNLRFRS